MLYKVRDNSWFCDPQKMTGNLERRRATNKKCNYHRDWGHMTKDCFEYKKFLDEKAAGGLLDEYVAERKKDQATLVEEVDCLAKPKGLIQMIQGSTTLRKYWWIRGVAQRSCISTPSRRWNCPGQTWNEVIRPDWVRVAAGLAHGKGDTTCTSKVCCVENRVPGY